MRDITVDTVFVGSCTNGRIEDLRAAAAVLEGRQVADGVTMLVVPGSARVRLAAEAEGLDEVFTAAGAQWRNAGLLDVHGHEPRPARPGAAQRVDVATATSRAVRARARARTSCRRRSPPPPRSLGHLASPADLLAPDPRPPQEGAPAMDKFTVHTGRALPLRRSNVDTDQIIPGEYLKRITRHGYEDALFAEWRTEPDFVLNQPTVRRCLRSWWPGPSSAPAPRASTRCGRCRTTASRSCSRSRFADIFRGNSGKIGLLTAVVDQDVIEALWALVEADPTTEVTVDLVEPRGALRGDARGPVRGRRLRPLAPARGPRRHRHHPAATPTTIAAFEAARPSYKPTTI